MSRRRAAGTIRRWRNAGEAWRSKCLSIPPRLLDARQPSSPGKHATAIAARKRPCNRHPREESTMTDAELDELAINTIRTLSIDAVQAANSGHPGTPMALAPLVYTLWNRVMRFDPQDPIWPGRDRFVLSNGHASMLLWSVLYLTGTQAVNADYEWLARPAVSLEDLRGPF